MLAAAGSQLDPPASEPDYPLGPLGVPRFVEPAAPVRVADIDAGLTEEGSTTAFLETRLKIGSRLFVGGEYRGDRVGAFVDTQRLELGLTEENGRVDVEGSIRAPWFLIRVDANESDGVWALESHGSVRVSSDWELLFDYAHDANDGGGGPPSLDAFIETSRLPPLDPPTRALDAGGLGFLYQRGNHLELESRARISRIRSEAGFEYDRKELWSRAVWNERPFLVDGAFSLARTGRFRMTEAAAAIGVAWQLGDHLVARASSEQRWQPGIERSIQDYRAAMTFYGRRFRFARASEAAEEMSTLQRRVNALGYNERRVYDIDEIRALRDRLSISPARRELSDALDALYRAQVRERNVPQLGVEYARTVREIEGSTTHSYRAFFGVPWPLRWPFATGESLVEFVGVDVVFEEERFTSVGWTRRGYELVARVELDRQNIVRFTWTDPGQTPEELSLRIERPHRFTVSYEYALGR